jgi:hypothetical protein
MVSIVWDLGKASHEGSAFLHSWFGHSSIPQWLVMWNLSQHGQRRTKISPQSYQKPWYILENGHLANLPKQHNYYLNHRLGDADVHWYNGMPLFKCRGRSKVDQIAPLVNHYKIHTYTQAIKTKKNGTNMATNIVNFKTNVPSTLDILPNF